MRLDQWLVQELKVRSRSQAEELIKRGEVKVYNLGLGAWLKIFKPSFKIDQNIDPSLVKITSVLLDYVARSGYKLEKAVEHVGLKIQQLNCLDVGQSTGGFSQFLLNKKAKLVVGVDVGVGQLDPKLSRIPNLISFENLDFRDAHKNKEFLEYSPFDLVVIDVSFISLVHILESVPGFLTLSGKVLALVKPQFELSKKDLDKRGRVKDLDKYEDVEIKIKNFIEENKRLKLLDFFQSELEGKDGNKEFFIYLQKLG